MLYSFHLLTFLIFRFLIRLGFACHRVVLSWSAFLLSQKTDLTMSRSLWRRRVTTKKSRPLSLLVKRWRMMTKRMNPRGRGRSGKVVAILRLLRRRRRMRVLTWRKPACPRRVPGTTGTRPCLSLLSALRHHAGLRGCRPSPWGVTMSSRPPGEFLFLLTSSSFVFEFRSSIGFCIAFVPATGLAAPVPLVAKWSTPLLPRQSW